MGISINDLGPYAQKQVLEQLAQNAQKRAQEKQQGQRKYNNTPTERNATEGKKLRFDSLKEAARFDELMLLLKAEKICDLRLQQEFTLIEAYTTPDGKRVRAERYKADFTYYRENGEFVVEDVKGGKATQTKVYAIKKKQMLEKYGIEITEI